MALDNEYQSMVANGIIHAASMAGLAWQDATYQLVRPSVLHRPAVYRNGNSWCALYGSDIQAGVCGFGETPEKAMLAFDAEWCKS